MAFWPFMSAFQIDQAIDLHEERTPKTAAIFVYWRCYAKTWHFSLNNQKIFCDFTQIVWISIHEEDHQMYIDKRLLWN